MKHLIKGLDYQGFSSAGLPLQPSVDRFHCLSEFNMVQFRALTTFLIVTSVILPSIAVPLHFQDSQVLLP